MKSRIIGIVFSIMAIWLSAIGSVAILVNVHDYNQTRHMMVVASEDASYPRWIPLFYFLNEAGSGIKYVATQNARHMMYFPTISYIETVQRENFRHTKMRAKEGDWCSQLDLVHLYLNGVGNNADIYQATRWYAVVSARLDRDFGSHTAWGSMIREYGVEINMVVPASVWKTVELEVVGYPVIKRDCDGNEISGNPRRT